MPLLVEDPPHAQVIDDEFPPDIPDDDDGGWDDDDDDENDPTRWVTVATFWQPTHAHIARLKLESEDIDCFIIDENLVATDWLYANAVGGIKLQVPEEDAPRARAILQAVKARSDEPIERCPECESTDFAIESFTRSWSFFLILTAAILLLFVQPLIGLVLFLPLMLCSFGSMRTCQNCGHRWQTARSSTSRGFEVVTKDEPQ